MKSLMLRFSKRQREKFRGLTKKGASKMELKKLKKLFDQALIVVLLTVSTIQFLGWFPQYELVVVGAMVLATLRLVR